MLVILAPIVFAIVAAVLVLKLAAGLVRAVFAFALFLAALRTLRVVVATADGEALARVVRTSSRAA